MKKSLAFLGLLLANGLYAGQDGLVYECKNVDDQKLSFYQKQERVSKAVYQDAEGRQHAMRVCSEFDVPEVTGGDVPYLAVKCNDSNFVRSYTANLYQGGWLPSAELFYRNDQGQEEKVVSFTCVFSH